MALLALNCLGFFFGVPVQHAHRLAVPSRDILRVGSSYPGAERCSNRGQRLCQLLSKWRGGKSSGKLSICCRPLQCSLHVLRYNCPYLHKAENRRAATQGGLLSPQPCMLKVQVIMAYTPEAHTKP